MRAILLGGGVALLISLLGTRVAINLFTNWGYGQEIRDDGPTSHHTKRGTPTMGGAVFIIAAIVGYFAAKLFTMTPPSASEPVSPMKLAAGEAFHQRNPKQAPVMAAATTARSSGSRVS